MELGGSEAFGTIGCLATTAAGQVVALTCHHVVTPPVEYSTNLTANVAGNTITFGVSDAKPIYLDSLVKVSILPPGGNSLDAFYTTVAGDQPSGIAIQVAAAISALTGISASHVGAAVTVTGGQPTCNVYGPPVLDLDSDLRGSVVGPAIDFSGEISGDDYGIFVNVNPGGTRPTLGVHYRPAKGATLSAIASDVASAINALPATLRGSPNPVTAQPTAARVSVAGGQEVECIIHSDRQVGQPDNSFGSPCSRCCSHRIGRVLTARIDVDTAIIQLDQGQKYKPEVQDIGLVAGTRAVQPSDVNTLTVRKRGRTTTLTFGKVVQLNVSADVAGSSGFHRHYTNGTMIASAPPTTGPMALPGDSGSAVLDANRNVLGILFAAASTIAVFTPVEQITAAFAAAVPPLVLDFAPAPAPGHAPGDVRVVAFAPDAQPAGAPAPALQRALAGVEADLSASEPGRAYLDLVRRHAAEAGRLVNNNRRVAAVWRRNGGPQILSALFAILQRRDQPLPEQIDGRPLTLCLERIGRALARYASPALAADLARHGALAARLPGMSYVQLLAALQEQMEQAA